MPAVIDSNLLKTICEGLALDGYVSIDDAFPSAFMTDILHQIQSKAVNQFKPAGIGRAADIQINNQIRSDEILWLDENRIENQNYFNWIETLRLALNQQFYLGLFEYECMFAHYPAGAFYQKHVDTFKQIVDGKGSKRRVSTILYLNPDWQLDDGGELLLYNHDQEQPFMRIMPTFGKLVVFLSEEFPHEVLPAQKSRYSLTGWFRIKD